MTTMHLYFKQHPINVSTIIYDYQSNKFINTLYNRML